MATYEEKSSYCKDCDKKVLKKRKGTNHLLHLILSFLTAGIWIIVWILTAIKFGGWYCSICGSKKVS